MLPFRDIHQKNYSITKTGFLPLEILAAVDKTLGVILKYQDDIAKVRGESAQQMFGRSQNRA